MKAMPRRPGPILRSLRHACAVALMGLVALPEMALAASPARGRSLDAMSDAELERLVHEINASANWRKYRRPGDPPDFVPGAPVKVMFGAGAALGRGGGMRAGGGSFRRNGLNSRRSGLSNRRRGGREDNTSALGSSRGRGTSSNRTESSFGGSSRSSSSNSMNSFNTGAFGEN